MNGANTDGRNRFDGPALLDDPVVNKGTAFTPDERRAHKLEGLLPPAVESLDRQARAGARPPGRQADRPGAPTSTSSGWPTGTRRCSTRRSCPTRPGSSRSSLRIFRHLCTTCVGVHAL